MLSNRCGCSIDDPLVLLSGNAFYGHDVNIYIDETLPLVNIQIYRLTMMSIYPLTSLGISSIYILTHASAESYCTPPRVDGEGGEGRGRSPQGRAARSATRPSAPKFVGILGLIKPERACSSTPPKGAERAAQIAALRVVERWNAERSPLFVPDAPVRRDCRNAVA